MTKSEKLYEDLIRTLVDDRGFELYREYFRTQELRLDSCPRLEVAIEKERFSSTIKIVCKDKDAWLNKNALYVVNTRTYKAKSIGDGVAKIMRFKLLIDTEIAKKEAADKAHTEYQEKCAAEYKEINERLVAVAEKYGWTVYENLAHRDDIRIAVTPSGSPFETRPIMKISNEKPMVSLDKFGWVDVELFHKLITEGER